MSLAALGPPPTAGGSRDTPSTPATVPLWASPRQLSLLQYLQDANLHTPLLLTEQRLPSKGFHLPLPHSLLLLPSQLLLLFFLLPFFPPVTFCLFLTPSPPSASSLSVLHASICSPFSLPSTGMTTTLPFPSKGRGATIPYPTAPKGLCLCLSLPCTPGLCLEAGTSPAKGCFSLPQSSGYAYTLIWLQLLERGCLDDGQCS